MERSLIATGIGGQGIQLSAQVMARAAIHDGRKAMLFGSYGGMMRGGSTDASVVLADGPIDSPPVLSRCWLGIAMHHQYLPGLLEKLDDRSTVFVNTSVIQDKVDTAASVVDFGATELAVEAVSLVCATMVMVGAVAAATSLLSPEALEAGLAEALPPYRREHFDLNTQALAVGYDAGLELAGSYTIPAAWATR
ncbi:MAG: hypothetical protein F4Y27_13835 [Acidimicrobiaceae bacterium]|nr:hypothetical protein [Acidimicrobiaceae bacterium]MYA75743.1 hypothetical protein [Acidimicrobiaceae bacterium]MYC41275.1 hypothetical protein [Acidimicrobiaceae bacterium]MYG54345.1 hypothetical protein [Acidimicrobiaceae bacterium]MYH87209.1 hypothetical protein [Acidimicrobiaceae bacterium]